VVVLSRAAPPEGLVAAILKGYHGFADRSALARAARIAAWPARGSPSSSRLAACRH